jgi:hypothetical protein
MHLVQQLACTQLLPKDLRTRVQLLPCYVYYSVVYYYSLVQLNMFTTLQLNNLIKWRTFCDGTVPSQIQLNNPNCSQLYHSYPLTSPVAMCISHTTTLLFQASAPSIHGGVNIYYRNFQKQEPIKIPNQIRRISTNTLAFTMHYHQPEETECQASQVHTLI